MNAPLVGLLDALKNDELSAYLMGEKGYRCENKWREVPTDLTAVFRHAFNAYVDLNEANNTILKTKLHDAFLELLKDAVGTWWTLVILHDYFFGFKENALLFSIDVKALVPHVTASLNAFKEDLKADKNWEGWQHENGLWEEVIHLVPKINQKLKQDNAPTLIEIDE